MKVTYTRKGDTRFIFRKRRKLWKAWKIWNIKITLYYPKQASTL